MLFLLPTFTCDDYQTFSVKDGIEQGSSLKQILCATIMSNPNVFGTGGNAPKKREYPVINRMEVHTMGQYEDENPGIIVPNYVDPEVVNYDDKWSVVKHCVQDPITLASQWLWISIDNIHLWDYNLCYYVAPAVLLVETIPFHTLGHELGTWWTTEYTFYWSVLLDFEFISKIYHNPYLNEWTRRISDHVAYAIMARLHPELPFVDCSVVNAYVLPYTSEIFTTIFTFAKKEGLFDLMSIAFDLVVYGYFVCMFVVFFMSYYLNSTTDENTIDQDFFASSLSVEAEEEIASIDDISLGLVFFVLLFGWFFYANVLSILTSVPETFLLVFFIPALYYIIAVMPVLLLYDFGIYFLAYLRGAATSPAIAMELLYDYIAFAAFFVRLAVQNVRILLMVFTFVSLYECVFTLVMFADINAPSETLWETLNNHSRPFSHRLYYFLLVLPTHIVYWMYELLHTFFVLTAQFLAFFAMVFWLFLFLYTMFTIDKQEDYFTDCCERRKKIRDNLLKNSEDHSDKNK